MKKNALILMALLICPVVLMAQRVTDYLKTGETLQFNNKTYHLGWSSHPTDAYYVQENFPEGEKAESYHEMFTVSVPMAKKSFPSSKPLQKHAKR